MTVNTPLAAPNASVLCLRHRRTLPLPLPATLSSPLPGALLASSAGSQGLQDAAPARAGVRPLVLPQLRLAVGCRQRQQHLLSSLPVLWLTCPRLERGGLQGPAVAESEAPGRIGAGLIQGLQVEGALLLRHAAAEEVDAWHSSGDAARRIQVKPTSKGV
eukprot:GHRQ01019741.1.p1 GENE.GHRQ01019741.1~~GHRQ01019741.1.p1  ORF type:complete len:160 (-),score=13.76 GHRQ01019741.1:159-638(-)